MDDKKAASPPLQVVATRGDLAETVHSVSYVVLSADTISADSFSEDRVLASAGDINAPVYGRSSTKPFQAVPLLTSGAADAFGLDDRHLALACASHNAEDAHVELVSEWLTRIGCDEPDLECGVMHPFQPARGRELAAVGVSPDQRHHMCSGKHAGFLTLAKHLGAPTTGYIDIDHPAQVAVRSAIETLTGADLDNQPWGVDGCGVPTFATSLLEFARGALFFLPPTDETEPADSTDLTDKAAGAVGPVSAVGADVATACARISTAMMRHPHLVAGSNRLCTEAMLAAPGQLALKTGAAGVFFGAARPAEGAPFALALKVHDGTTIAAEVAVLHVLANHGLDLRRSTPAIEARQIITNIAGRQVGSRTAL